MIGRVVSTKMKNTAAVLVERMAMHPLYKKKFIQSKKYLADITTSVKEGDMVEIVKIRPVSKNKHWRIIKIVGKNLEEITKDKLKEAAEKVIAEALPAGRQVMPEEKEGDRVQGIGSSEETKEKEKLVAKP